jgi:hypothetical protein
MKTRPKAWCLPENLQDFAESKWLESHEVLAANATLVPPASHHPEKTMFLKQLPNIKISSGWGRASSPRQIPRWDDLGPARRKSICFFFWVTSEFPRECEQKLQMVFSCGRCSNSSHQSTVCLKGVIRGNQVISSFGKLWKCLPAGSKTFDQGFEWLFLIISYFIWFNLREKGF